MNDIIEAEYKESVPAHKTALSVVENAKQEAKDFDQIKAALLDRTRHVNNIGGRDRVNAAGWQVIAAALNVRVEIVSKNAHGHPGAARGLLEDHKGRKMVSFAVTVRATSGERVQERTGRCDSTETKHNQYEHKMESVALTRAINRAVCAIVGGEPSDNADEAEDEQYAREEQVSQARKQVSTAEISKLWQEKGKPEGSAQQFCAKHVPGYRGSGALTPEQSLIAYNILSSLP